MPRHKAVKKQKLSKEERSQIAKDRWAKRRKAHDEPIQIGRVSEANKIQGIMDRTSEVSMPPPVDPGPKDPTVDASSGEFVPAPPPPVPIPAPQLVPVKAPKQKRIPVPREFLLALKTADKRLAEAIDEYEDCQRRIFYLKDAIPRLQRTVLALKSESNPDIPVHFPAPFDFSASAQDVQAPPVYNPLASIQAAMAAPPASRAQGGAIQFGPDIVGELESEADDPDKYITGPAASEKGWI
jgi:hypothetical protein